MHQPGLTQRSTRLAFRQPPPLDSTLFATGSHARAVRTNHQGEPPPGLPCEYETLLSGLSIPNPDGVVLARRHQWHGTRDLSAFLAVPAAIDFWERPDVARRREECRAIAFETRERIAELTGRPALSPKEAFGQMIAVELPACDPAKIQVDLFDRFRIEVPCFRFFERPILRASFQVYNTAKDAEALCSALGKLVRPLL